MEIKTYRARIAIKADGDKGEFTAAFATLNVIDHDQDVTLPGAFGTQQVLIEPWNHNSAQPPVGKGDIGEEGDQGLVQGRFFLDTQPGKEHYIVVKELADLQEWSYSFYIVEAEPGMFEGQQVRFLKKLDVIGVGPVSRGAGIGTHTVDIKGLKPYPNEHSCRLVDPDKFVRCIRKEVTDENEVDGYEPTGQPYSLIICYTEDGKSEVQAFRYKKETWTEEQARKHCRAHGGTFEAAAGEESVCGCGAGKTGARHTGKEYEELQQIHDLAVELGAKCAEPGDSDEDQDEDPDKGKSRSPSAAFYRTRIEIENLDI